MDEILVKDIMTETVVSVESGVSIREAAEKMTSERVGSLIVTSSNRPVGILTESDIIKKVVSFGENPEKMTVGQIMSAPIIFVSPLQNVTDAASLMISNRTRRLPVVENGKIVGIITHTDIVRASPAMIHLLEERLKMRSGAEEIPRREARIRVGDMAGICDDCGNYSMNLTSFHNDFLCENCLKEHKASNQKRDGFRDWSRMS
ncbi:MAG: CBS domain-containing protein [Candidatus Aenigmarchaeota archaeon]|nr:CBS domain-containing protein [Candidatus Aenigmarchaeota archaeon]